MYTLIVRFVNLHKFKMPNGRVCSPLGFKQITFHPSLNILKRFSFLLFAYHPVVWWTITCVSVAAFLLICSHSARVSIWPFGFKMCIEPSLQHNLKKKYIFLSLAILSMLSISTPIYLWWYTYWLLPAIECQCFGPLNQAGKSHRSAGGDRLSVIIRDPT